MSKKTMNNYAILPGCEFTQKDYDLLEFHNEFEKLSRSVKRKGKKSKNFEENHKKFLEMKSKIGMFKIRW